MNPFTEAALREAGLDRYAAPLAALVRPCVHLLSRASDDAEVPVGATKVGGAPDLPDDAAWPEWNGAPLAFLAQVDLRAVVGMPGAEVLPGAGLLSFFYDAEQSTWGFDPADRGSWRVLYAPADAPLRRRHFPAALPDDGRYGACAVEARAASSLPSWDEPVVEALVIDDDAQDAFFGLTPIEPYAGHRGAVHQLLGWPDPIQSAEMGLECQLASHGIYVGGPEGYADPRAAELRPGAAEWRLLLQMDSDEDAGVMWGDAGRLYFWIRESDLAARDWDGVWMVLQCS